MAEALKSRAVESIAGRVSRLAVISVAAALLGVTGCGGSDEAAPTPPPSAAAAPAAQSAPGGGAAPVANTGGDGAGAGSIARDIENERVASRDALRKWGVSAERACRKAERKVEPWLARMTKFKAPKNRRATAKEVERAGKLIVDFAHAAEYEYELLRAIELPTQPDAIDQIESFFDKEEEALMLVQRLGIELQKRNDREGFLSSLDRLRRLSDDYKRAGRAVGARSCVDDD
jgi:hypothetical protein